MNPSHSYGCLFCIPDAVFSVKLPFEPQRTSSGAGYIVWENVTELEYFIAETTFSMNCIFSSLWSLPF